MKFFGEADLQNNEIKNAELSTDITISELQNLPTPRAVGHIAFVGSVLYICTSVTPNVTWVPLTRELTAYSYEQVGTATTWNITHDLNTVDVTVVIYDTNNQAIIPESITTTGANTVVVTFSTAQAGRAAVVTGSFQGPVRITPNGNIVADWGDITSKPSFATVATSGSYADLLNKPTFATAATSGSYADLLNKPTLATVATSGSYADLVNTPTLSGLLVVAKNGNDTAGDGSFGKPFLTLQKAHDTAESTLATSATVVILAMPGTYAESLALTRPRTSIVGLAGIEFGTVISSPVTITPSRRVAHPSNSAFAFDNVFFNTSGSNNALTFTGSQYSGALNLRKVRIYTSNGKAIVMNNTATDLTATASNNRLNWLDVDIQTDNGSKNGVELQNVMGTAKETNIYSGSGQAVVLGAGTLVTFADSLLDVVGTKIASVANTGTLLLRGATCRNGQNDADGIDIAAGGVVYALETTFAHSTTSGNTGFAIKGTAGAVLIHGLLTFFNNSPTNAVINNRVSSAVSRIAATTTLTPA